MDAFGNNRHTLEGRYNSQVVALSERTHRSKLNAQRGTYLGSE